MDRADLERLISEPNGMSQALRVLNEEINRLIKFAKNAGTYQNKIYPDLVNISEDRK